MIQGRVSFEGQDQYRRSPYVEYAACVEHQLPGGTIQSC